MDYAKQKKNRLPYSLHWKSLQCSQGLEAKVTTLETVRTCCGTSTWLSWSAFP